MTDPERVLEAMDYAAFLTQYASYDPMRRPSSSEVGAIVRAALRAAEQAGWVMVPKEATWQMRERALPLADGDSAVEASCNARDIWDAMLAAAPKLTEEGK